MPLHAEPDRVWRLHSWDRFMVPQPLARVMIRYGRPFLVGAGEDGFTEGLEQATARLEEVSGKGAWVDGAIAIG